MATIVGGYQSGTNPMLGKERTMSDEIADFADRMAAKHRRGEDPEFEFEIEWGRSPGTRGTSTWR